MTKNKTHFIKILPWDTDFFKRSIARLSGVHITKEKMSFIMKECKKKKIECLYFTPDAHDQTSIDSAEDHNFNLASTRVTYERIIPTASKYVENEIIREATSSDKKQLLRLTDVLYPQSRFHQDKKFGSKEAKRLYYVWIEKILKNSLEKTKEKVFVICVSKTIAGYIAVDVKDDIVQIEFIVVDSNHRGKGFGRLLMEYCMAAYVKKGRNHFRVVTQGHNIEAQRLYQSCGFRIIATGLDFHKWFEKNMKR